MQIAVVNRSTQFSDADADAAVAAISMQLSEHVAPAWSRPPPDLQFVPHDQPPPEASNIIWLFDSGTHADLTLGPGWHNAGPNGEAYGKVFVSPVVATGGGMLTGGKVTVSTVLSHETMETFLDPALAEWSPDPDGTPYAMELCDPVEFETYEIKTGKGISVTVSNFLLPAWWRVDPADVKFDYLGTLTAPFSIRPDGYCVIKQDGAIQPRFGDDYPHWSLVSKTCHPSFRLAKRTAGAADPAAS